MFRMCDEWEELSDELLRHCRRLDDALYPVGGWNGWTTGSMRMMTDGILKSILEDYEKVRDGVLMNDEELAHREKLGKKVQKEYGPSLGNRKVILKTLVGSHLYGTATPDSDEDYLGIFLPNREDLLGLRPPPTEITDDVKLSKTAKNQKGDIDCKYLSLKQFFMMLLQGQSAVVELLFAPKENIQFGDGHWEEIKRHKDVFLSKKTLSPMIGFAVAQMRKSEIKGANLNLIRELIAYLKEKPGSGRIENLIYTIDGDVATLGNGIRVPYRRTIDGTPVVEVAQRKFNLGSRVKNFRDALIHMEARYGDRSEVAAAKGVDTKSLAHAYRLVSQTIEFLTTGGISFPLHEAARIKEIRAGHDIENVRELLADRIRRVEQELLPKSELPDRPDFDKANRLYMDIVEGGFG